MTFYLKVTAKWLGYMVERTLLCLGGIAWGVTSDILFWAIDMVAFPIRYIKAYDKAQAAACAIQKKGGQQDDR